MKINKIKLSIFCISAIFIVLSCNKSNTNTQNVVSNWLSKDVQIPTVIDFRNSRNDTTTYEHILKHRYKILVYVDSVGCTACRLRLREWRDYIDTCKLFNYDVGFLFVVQSKNYHIFESRLKVDNFTYPTIYDPADDWNKINKFPKEDKFRTFLLNDKNRVVLIGSPINNDKIRKLYDDVLRDGKTENLKQAKNENNISSIVYTTAVKLINNSVNLGQISYLSAKHISFQLRNTGEKPLIIQTVNTSCDCTAAKYDKKPVLVGQTATVMLEYKPNSLGYFSKTADVVCNVPEGFVRLKIKGEVVEK